MMLTKQDNGQAVPCLTITDNLIQKYMEYIPDYLKPFIIHKDYFPELIE